MFGPYREQKNQYTWEFSKVARYKINLQKSIAIFYTSNIHLENIIKNITFMITIKTQNYLSINQNSKDFYIKR